MADFRLILRRKNATTRSKH